MANSYTAPGADYLDLVLISNVIYIYIKLVSPVKQVDPPALAYPRDPIRVDICTAVPSISLWSWAELAADGRLLRYVISPM